MLILIVLYLVSTAAWTAPKAYTVRFSDMPDADTRITNEAEAPTVSANKWLRRNGWEQVWPIVLIGKGKPLAFAGTPQNRFLRVAANKSFFIWGSEVSLDPQEFPVLELVWGIEAFPSSAAMDLYGRNDRAIVVQVLFGDKLPTPGFPDLPRMLAYFWGETETVGNNYTCISPREGPADARIMCIYPHVKYIALRSGDEGSVFTDRVNLLDHFREQFPDYWREHQRVPTIVGLSFEAQSGHTKSRSSARLYSIRLLSGVEAAAWSEGGPGGGAGN
jgi:hypothetical protein